MGRGGEGKGGKPWELLKIQPQALRILWSGKEELPGFLQCLGC